MEWVTFIFDGGATPRDYTPNELREMFSIGDKQNVIPFVHSGSVVSNTSARILTIEVDPKRPHLGNSNPAPTASGHGADYRHGQQRVTITGDLTQIPIQFNRVIKSSLTFVCDAAAVWSITLFYDLVEGQFAPDTDIIERLADRRRMDIYDTDAAVSGQFRMGTVLKMGDAAPGG